MAQSKKRPSERAKAEVDNRQQKSVYGHPADVYQHAAIFCTGILADKLKPGEVIEVYEVALLGIGLKLAREVENPGQVPDNLTDVCGYADCAEMIYERRPPSKN